MIPYFEQPAWHIGPFTIHAFGIAVAAAMLVGLTMAQWRFERAGLDQAVGHRLGGWMVVGGILGAHLFSVLLYFPDKLRDNPWHLLRVWEDISSFGGMLGGALAGYVFFSLRLQATDWRTRLRYLDVAAFVFAPALAVGRIGCALAHDHPGVVTTFPLGISLETDAARDYLSRVYDGAGLPFPVTAEALGFHDLGLYELLFLTFVVVPAFVYWDRRQRPAGFYLIAFAALCLPVRFGFDMLRVADARYVGLTPAQWIAALGLTLLPFAAVHQRKLRFAIVGAVLLVTAWACRLSTACTDELGLRFSPPDPTVAVGQSFTASLELSSCGGRERWRPTVVWRTDDTLVVAVESSTGRVTGRAAGDALVLAVERDARGNQHEYPYLVRVR